MIQKTSANSNQWRKTYNCFNWSKIIANSVYKGNQVQFSSHQDKAIKRTEKNIDFLIPPEDLAPRECLLLSLNLNQAFPNAKVNARYTIHKTRTKPSFIIVNVYHGITEVEVKAELQSNNAMNVTKVSRITSRATDQPTKLISVITESNRQVEADQKWRQIRLVGWQLYRCEASREQPHVGQFFKSQKFDHSAKESSNAIRFLRCSQNLSVRDCIVSKHQMIKLWWRYCDSLSRLSSISAQVSWDLKKDEWEEIPNRRQHIQTSSKHWTIIINLKTAILVARVLSKLRKILNTMSYSDIINIVSNSASRICNEKNDDQKTYDSIKSANTAHVPSIQAKT